MMDDLLLPASDTDDNWFQGDEEEEENESEEESEDDEDENLGKNDEDMENSSEDDQEVSLVNGKFEMNGDDKMESD